MRNDIVPVRDLIDHDHLGEDCVCGPDWRFCTGGVVVVHHPLVPPENAAHGTYAAQAEVAALNARRRIEKDAHG